MKRVVLFFTLVLVGGNASAADHSGTLKKVADTGVFTIGYRIDSPPLSFVDRDGQPVGYSVDLCRRIAAALKEHLGSKEFSIEYEAVTSENRIDAVKDGSVDIVCGSTTMTLGRMERVDFTLMTFLTGASLLSRSATPINTAGDLAGKKVVVVKDTTTETALRTHLNTSLIDATVVTVDTHVKAMSLLNAGEVQAFASDQVVLIGQILQSDDPRAYILSQELFSFEPYGMIVRRNDPDFRLVANRAIARLYRSGHVTPLYNTWFGNVGLRPSPVLAAMYQLMALPE